MENDLQAEATLATEQYEALLAYAKRPDGLPQKLDRDRRAEMVALEHGRTEQVLFRLANILSFGKYTHREKANPKLEAELDVARRLAYHTRFLREVAKSSPQIDMSTPEGASVYTLKCHRSTVILSRRASASNIVDCAANQGRPSTEQFV